MSNQTEQLVSLQKKREAMEKLIAFAQQLSKITSSMESVQQMMRPSQMPKKKGFALLHQLIEQLKEVETDKLQTRLKVLDTQVEGEIKKIISLSKLTEDDIQQKFADQSREEIAKAHEVMLNELKDFARKAQTNVAIRYTLHQRGCTLSKAKLPISQEELGEQVEDLKAQEHKCKSQVTEHIEALIKDTDLMLQNPQFPDAMKTQLEIVKGNLEKNLELVQQGKNIEDIPVFMESLEMESSSHIEMAPIEPEPVEVKAEATEDQNAKLATVPTKPEPPSKPEKTNTGSPSLADLQEQYRQKGFFGRLWMWLNTPVGVSWSDIKRQTTISTNKPVSQKK